MTKEEATISIMMDIITKNLRYEVEAILNDEAFINSKELLCAEWGTSESIRKLVLQYGYEAVNETFKAMLQKMGTNKAKEQRINKMIDKLTDGFDGDPEFAHKELERMHALCIEAAEMLEDLK